MYDLAIIGGGPAGAAAGVYAARKKLKTVLIAEKIGGQSVDSMDIQNWIGTVSLPGPGLAESLEKHLKAYASDVLALATDQRAQKIEKTAEGFAITTEPGKSFEAHAILIATGSRRRKLKAEGAEEFDGKGIVYCASCDAPLFAGRDVVVVGGGNAGFETAMQLTEYATHITLLEREASYKADPVTVDRVLKHEKVTAVTQAEITKISGTKFVEGVTYKDLATGKEHALTVGGVFVEIGQIPNAEFAKGLIEMNEFGNIMIDPKTQQTSVPGIWAAGDVTDVLYHQNNIAAGDAVRALEDIYVHLKTKGEM